MWKHSRAHVLVFTIYEAFVIGRNGFRQTDIWKWGFVLSALDLTGCCRDSAHPRGCLKHSAKSFFISSSWSRRQKSGLCAAAVGSRRVAPGDQIRILSGFHGKGCWLEVAILVGGKSEQPPGAHARRTHSLLSGVAGTPEPPGTGTIPTYVAVNKFRCLCVRVSRVSHVCFFAPPRPPPLQIVRIDYLASTAQRTDCGKGFLLVHRGTWILTYESSL